MTGIERLYKLIADIDVSANPELWYILRGGTEGDWDCEERDDKTLDNTLAAIADQIEREQGGQVSRMRVLVVVTEMERHVSGVEGAEDSPVARWARELRAALGGDRRDRAADVSMSAYDLLPQEERDAIAWVREHGGLDAVERRWECLSYYADPVPRSCMERRLARLQRQIDESHAALRRRNQRIEELTHRVSDLTRENAELRKRDMPEGYGWPRYEDGSPVPFGDPLDQWPDYDGQFVFDRLEICQSGEFALSQTNGLRSVYGPGERVKRPAVPAGDGKPLEVGQTVWDTNGDELVVAAFEDGGHTVYCRYVDVGDGIPVHGMWSPSDLTHTKPEPPDSAERIADDIRRMAEEWCSHLTLREASKKAASSVGEATMGGALSNLSKRCRALAERERGE